MGGWLVPSGLDLSTARVLVAGLGVTGRAVVEALTGRAARVTTLDSTASEADLADATEVHLAEVDLIIVSPGWSPRHPLLLRASELAVPVWSEVELAWRLRVDRTTGGGPAPWLAVTGTNGKTTTVGMLTSMLRAAGAAVAEVGNVGTPVVTAALNPDFDVLAVELSSFQLHFTYSMAAHAAAVLNIAPDHIDWHGSFDHYVSDKGRIYERVVAACVFNAADDQTRGLVEAADVADGARAIGFSTSAPRRAELGLVDDVLCDRAFHLSADDPARHKSAQELATVSDLGHLAGSDGSVPGHVIANALAAGALARSYGISSDSVRSGLRGFTGGAHRIAPVGRVKRDGSSIWFVNDSKATNAHAAQASLGGFGMQRVVWIAGGLAKGADFDALLSSRQDKLRAAVLIGVDQDELSEALRRHAPSIPVVRIDSGDTGTVMTRAVQAAVELAESGDTVLLAPACASMDQFTSYADRGEAFSQAVRSRQDFRAVGA